jgi:hypothetical protein
VAKKLEWFVLVFGNTPHQLHVHTRTPEQQQLKQYTAVSVGTRILKFLGSGIFPEDGWERVTFTQTSIANWRPRQKEKPCSLHHTNTVGPFASPVGVLQWPKTQKWSMVVTVQAPITSYQPLQSSQFCSVLDPSLVGLAWHEEKRTLGRPRCRW